ncbi:MAG: DHH family phosphoesterase [Planctomycetes bacterium]|nr:DHH family phosphoesterase [Planctomycetota bacterium]
MTSSSRLTTKAKVKELRDVLADIDHVWLLMHDAPDPDAMATAMCLEKILRKAADVRGDMIYGGHIARPDNLAMVDLLDVSLTHIKGNKIDPKDHFVCVDTQPSFSNNSLPDNAKVVGVFDHHPAATDNVPFMDIREEYGALVTVAFEYVEEAGLDYDSRLATAVAYGIASETEDLGREVSQRDLEAYIKVLPKVNHVLMGRLHHPRVERQFFSTLAAALGTAQIYEDLAICHLARLNADDELARVADILNSMAGTRWVFCTGEQEDVLLLCLRTTDTDANAGDLLNEMVGDYGGAGGHDMVAGGNIPLDQDSDPDQLREFLESTFLRKLGVSSENREQLLNPPAQEKIP